MSADNIVVASFGEGNTAQTRPLYQWDYGQVLQFSDVLLPETYIVHFANWFMVGCAKTQIGNADGVEIPDEFLTTGQPVYAWLFLHAGEDDGETVYVVTIPVIKRPKPTEDEPTPVQRGLIDAAISALNAAMPKVAAAEKYAAQNNIPFDPDDPDAYIGRYIARVMDVSAQGHIVWVPVFSDDESMMESGFIPVYPGDMIQILKDGEPVSGLCVAQVAADKETYLQSYSGEDMSIYPITDNAAYMRFPMLIADKSKYIVRRCLPKLEYPFTSGEYVPKITVARDGDVKKAIAGWGTAPSAPVRDVQVNGTSVVNDGVANVPIASSTNLGVVYAAGDGIFIYASGKIVVQASTSAEIKAGTNGNKPIVPGKQHEAAFYGLAKAAGDTSQSASSNAVGTYTDAAKDAIMLMLGIIDMIAPHEGAQASRSYGVGGVFVHAGKLYKSTAAIAIGNAITPGANCVQTTLGELIGSV